MRTSQTSHSPAKLPNPMPSVTFEITVPPDTSKQQVVIVGTDRALGDWKPENGLVLEKRNGKFVGSTDVSHGIIEFKITRGSWLTEATSRDGSRYPNSLYLVQHDMTISLEVENWNDSPPAETELLNGKTCRVPAPRRPPQRTAPGLRLAAARLHPHERHAISSALPA